VHTGISVNTIVIGEFAPFGYPWISVNIDGYARILMDITWISFGNLDIVLDLSNERYP
jgi:hypothetical protein